MAIWDVTSVIRLQNTVSRPSLALMKQAFMEWFTCQELLETSRQKAAKNEGPQSNNLQELNPAINYLNDLGNDPAPVKPQPWLSGL